MSQAEIHRYVLPQRCSSDRRRARCAALARERERFQLTSDDLLGSPAPGFRLPPHVKDLPSDADFPPSKKVRLLLEKRAIQVNALANRGMSLDLGLRSERAYRRMFRYVEPPELVAARWRLDEEFARQRLAGVNPMAIRRVEAPPPEALAEAAARMLERWGLRLNAVIDGGRLFTTTYEALWHDKVQRVVRARSTVLAAPSCLFALNDKGMLLPIAIQLKPPDAPQNPVYTPEDDEYAWLAARCHAASADAHYHEGAYHLLETHLVCEAIAVCLYREVHPDHPVFQLLHPHFEHNLAIDAQARGNLLAKDGPIDTAMAGGVPGALDAARLFYRDWSWKDRSLHADLEARGADSLPHFPYAEDARLVWDALHAFVSRIVRLWYRSDADVAADFEIQGWAAAVARPETAGGAGIPGFPERFDGVDGLIRTLTDLIFRCGPQHAAVNNGQYDSYGFVPNTPGAFGLPVDDPPKKVTEADFWRAMPSRKRTLAQLGMTRILSIPTHRTLLHTGDAEAFLSASSQPAADAVRALRLSLRDIHRQITARNEDLQVPYLYLDPENISRSTDI